MILNKEISVNVDGTPVTINTRDYLTVPVKEANELIITVTFFNKTEEGTKRLFELYDSEGGKSKVAILNFNGIQILYIDGVSANYASKYIIAPFNQETTLKFKYCRKQNGIKTVEIWNLTSGVYLYEKELSNWNFDLSKNPVLYLSTYDKRGSLGTDVKNLILQGEYFNLQEKSNTNYNKGDKGTTLTIHTSYVANKPTGVNVPNYTDNLDYINQVIRADNVDVYHKATVYISNNFKAIEGATIMLTNSTDINGQTQFITDIDGKVTISLKNKIHQINISALKYLDLNNQEIKVDFSDITTRFELLFDNTTIDEVTFINETKYNKASYGVLGMHQNRIDGIQLIHNGNDYVPLEINQTIVLETIEDLRKIYRRPLNSIIYINGARFKLKSKNDNSIEDNNATTIITNLGDVYKLIQNSKGFVYAEDFGLKGDGTLEDIDKVNYLFKYAIDKNLIIKMGNKDYVIDSLKNKKIVIDNCNGALKIDWEGSTLRRYWEMIHQPHRLVEKKLIGTFNSFTHTQETADLNLTEEYKNLNFTSNNNTLNNTIKIAHSETEFKALTGLISGDYVLFYDETRNGSKELRKIVNTNVAVTSMIGINDLWNTGVFETVSDLPKRRPNHEDDNFLAFVKGEGKVYKSMFTGSTINWIDSGYTNYKDYINSGDDFHYMRDIVYSAKSAMRDRFFIANDDLTKRFSFYDNFDNQSDNVVGSITSKDEFTVGEDLYFYKYVTNRKVSDNTADIELKYDSYATFQESMYRPLGTEKWLQYTNDKEIPEGAMYIQSLNKLEFYNLNFDNRHPYEGDLNLDKTIDWNYLNTERDQFSALSKFEIIKHENNANVYEDIVFDNCTFKNYLSSHFFRYNGKVSNGFFNRLKFINAGDITLSGAAGTFPSNKDSYIKNKNITIINDYNNRLLGSGVLGSSEISDNSNNLIKGVGAFGRTVYFSNVRTNINDIKIERFMGKDIMKNNPFLNGKCTGQRNGNIIRVIGKNGNGGYRRFSSIFIDNFKIASLSYLNDNVIFDNDAITGSFIRYDNLEVDFSYQQNGGSRFEIQNSDILGGFVPTSHDYTVGRESEGGSLFSSVKNCSLKVHNSISQVLTRVSATIIDGLVVENIQNYDLSQHRFFHQKSKNGRNKGIELYGDIVNNVISYLPLYLPLQSKRNKGWFTYNALTDDYDTVNSKGVFDIGLGGKFTQRSPQPTETDSAGNKKIVSTMADLIKFSDPTANNLDFGSGFYESYKGGWIEIADEQVPLNDNTPANTVNVRYRNIAKVLNSINYWGRENGGTDIVLNNKYYDSIIAPSVGLVMPVDESYPEKFYLSNINNLYVNSTFKKQWDTNKHGKSIIYFKNVNFILSGSTQWYVGDYSLMNQFMSPSRDSGLMALNKAYPRVFIFDNCYTLNMSLGQINKQSSQPILFSPHKLSVLNKQGNNKGKASHLKSIHPQMHYVDLNHASQLDLDTAYLGNCEDNQELIIDLTVNGASILHNGVVYENLGKYTFEVKHNWDFETITSSVIYLVNHPSLNSSGSTLSLSNEKGDNYNFKSSDTKNYLIYNSSNPIVNGKVEVLVNAPSQPVVKEVNGSDATLLNGDIFIPNTEMTMSVKYNGIYTEYKFFKR